MPGRTRRHRAVLARPPAGERACPTHWRILGVAVGAGLSIRRNRNWRGVDYDESAADRAPARGGDRQHDRPSSRSPSLPCTVPTGRDETYPVYRRLDPCARLLQSRGDPVSRFYGSSRASSQSRQPVQRARSRDTYAAALLARVLRGRDVWGHAPIGGECMSGGESVLRAEPHNHRDAVVGRTADQSDFFPSTEPQWRQPRRDRKSTRLNSSHSQISYAVFCLKKKKKTEQ